MKACPKKKKAALHHRNLARFFLHSRFIQRGQGDQEQPPGFRILHYWHTMILCVKFWDWLLIVATPHACARSHTLSTLPFSSVLIPLLVSLFSNTDTDLKSFFPKKQWLPLCFITPSTPPPQFSQEPTSQFWFPRTFQ